MARWTPFKPLLNRSISGEPKGTMQDTPCRGFQPMYGVLVEYDAEVLGIGMTQQNAELRVQILAADESTVLFDSTLKVKYQIITLDLGGVTLYTWNVGQVWDVKTTVPETFRTLAGEQPYAIPGGGSDYGTGSCIVQFDLYFGNYLIPLPAGAIFKVKFHNVGMSGLTFVPVKTSVLPGGNLAGYRLPADGMTRLILPSNGMLQFNAGCDMRGLVANAAGAWPHSASAAPTGPQVQSLIAGTEGAGNSLLFYLSHGTPWVVFEQAGGLFLAQSITDGKDWLQKVQLAANASLLAGDVGADGATLYLIALRGSNPVLLICSSERSQTGDAVLRVTEEITPTGLPTLSGAGLLFVKGGLFRLVVDHGSGVDAYISADGGRTWT